MNQEEANELSNGLRWMADRAGTRVDQLTMVKLLKFIQAAVTPDKPEAGETVRVRIAVSVNADGGWVAEGESSQPDSIIAKHLQDCLVDPRSEDVLHWVEADLPTSVTVEGVVSDATDNAIVRGHDD